jgi:hypothetical protein
LHYGESSGMFVGKTLHMGKLRLALFWIVSVVIFWFCALWLLFRLSPISFDGSGPMPTFYWGLFPSPTLAEYARSRSIRLLFLYPYWVAASMTTFFGCGLAASLVQMWRRARARPFLYSAAMTLLSLFVIATVSDMGVAYGVWRGPVMIWWKGSMALRSALVLLFKVLLPMSLLSGFVACGQRRLERAMRTAERDR